MAIIPRYTSRALPPGAQPGMIESALSRGKAGARLAAAAGDTIIAGIDFKKRKDAADAARNVGGSKMSGKNAGTGTKTGVPNGKNGTAGKSGKVASARGKLTGRTTAEKERNRNFDNQSGETRLARAEAEITKQRASGYASAKTGGGPAKGLASRALADFDGAAGKLAEGLKNQPHLKSRFDAMVDSSRAPLELRMLTLENARRVDEEKAVLSDSLDTLALAAVDDPAMAPGVVGRGLAQIESAMKVGMLAPEEAAEMQGGFAARVHMSAMRGQIAVAPEDVQARLEAGEFDDIFEPAERDQLAGEARMTARLKATGASAAARARRRGLEIGMADYLAAVTETGAGDEAVAARVRTELSPAEQVVFQAAEAGNRERYATRQEYAFMTAAEIEADIAQRAEGGPRNIDRRDSDERKAAHAIRTETRDEVLAARATDPAGWAMRDADVAAAHRAAQENPDDPALARHAAEQRLALQREMGIEQPRLLSDAERDEIAGALAQATPADRPAIVAALRARYGPHAGMLSAELTGEIDANTALLIAHAEVPHLPRLIAQGMEKAKKDGPATLTLASPEAQNDLPALPLIETGVPGGYRLDISSLKSGRTYRAPGGATLFYNGEILVPATVEMAPAASPTGASGAPTPAPVEIEPLLPPMVPRGQDAAGRQDQGSGGGGAGPEGEQATPDVESDLPIPRRRPENIDGDPSGKGEEVSGEEDLTPEDIPDIKDRLEFENLSIAKKNAKREKAALEEKFAFKQQQFSDGKIGAKAMGTARQRYKNMVAEQDGKIEKIEMRQAEIRTKPEFVPEIDTQTGEIKAGDSGDLEEGFITLPTGPEDDEPVKEWPRAKPRPVRTAVSGVPFFYMGNPVKGLPRLRRDNLGDPEFGARRVRKIEKEDGTVVYEEYEHRGMDVAVPAGEAIYSPFNGRVAYIGDPYGDGRYKIMWIDRDDGGRVGFFYVTPFDAEGNELLKAGDRITTGSIIGTMQDRAAESPGMENHTHIKVIVNGNPVDPSAWLNLWRREFRREHQLN